MLYQAAAFPGIALFFAIFISRTVPKTDILKLIYFWYMSAAFSFLNLRTIVVGFLVAKLIYIGHNALPVAKRIASTTQYVRTTTT